ncbi:MAG TPA: YjbQ family protein [Actinomycetota bacterium]|nr:YjbQ family protein [Actinomycetota bacterium]
MEVRTQNIDPQDEPDAHSHCRSALFGSSSQTIPIVDTQLVLGRWQRVFFIELDRARPRKVFIQVLGE